MCCYYMSELGFFKIKIILRHFLIFIHNTQGGQFTLMTFEW